MIGMIIPPGDIKKMVEKTASHVAKNGSQFEKALIEIQQNKPQFSFLLKENPYRAYYDHMVTEYSRRLMAENEEDQKKQQNQIKNQEKFEEHEKQIINEEQKQFLGRVFEEVKEPDPDKFTVEIPDKLSRGDMAMIQHTAQYAAINGKNFLVALSEREKNNPQYEFLRSSSLNYEYFSRLVEAYKGILQFNQNDMNTLMRYVSNKKEILDECQSVYEYNMMKQEQSRGKKQTEDHRKEQNIDWNDFQLVQTIIFDDFRPAKNETTFTKPLYDKNLEQKIISQPKRKEILQQCHICKKNILASEMNKHVKNCLSTKKEEKRNLQTSQTGDEVDVRKNLENLSIKRPDIFGNEGEKMKNQGGQEQKYIWDGQNPNITRTTASVAMVANQQKKIKSQLKEGKNNS